MNMIRHGPAPSERAASTYSFSRIESTWPRTIRPTDAQPKMAITMMTIDRPGPRIGDQGDTQQQERHREQQVHEPGQELSTRPPKYPAISPTAAPTRP